MHENINPVAEEIWYKYKPPAKYSLQLMHWGSYLVYRNWDGKIMWVNKRPFSPIYYHPVGWKW
jgi:hypothetical protein